LQQHHPAQKLIGQITAVATRKCSLGVDTIDTMQRENVPVSPQIIKRHGNGTLKIDDVNAAQFGVTSSDERNSLPHPVW